MADVVITPSAFVHRSLPASIRHFRACHVVPFGSPPVGTPIIPENLGRRGGNGAALRVLFAGSMTQRKGLADLFAAIALLNRSDIELVVMGSLQAPMEFYRSELNHFLYEGPRPHAEVLKLMQSCDVLVLPSIVEGRALVQQEALACGLPLIVTANAGGEDLIEEGKTGFLVPIRSPEAIAERISYLADHTEILSHLRASARQKAAMYTWEHYGDQVTGAISQALSCFPRTAKT
jgi:glycosyltransferase involved in cell wall biosynthesis